MVTWRRLLVVLAAAAASVFIWSEILHWRSSRRGLAVDGKNAPQREAIVVLGYRNPGSRANIVNRYRVRAALRSITPGTGESVLVLCGGAVGGAVSEAELLSAYARKRGYVGRMLLDTTSTTTRQNIENAIPLIEGFDAIRIVSNSPHAELARVYLRELRPDLAARLRRAQEHRFGEVLYMKPYSAVRGLSALSRVTDADGRC